MNIAKLKQAEAVFLDRYRGRFDDSEIVAIALAFDRYHRDSSPEVYQNGEAAVYTS